MSKVIFLENIEDHQVGDIKNVPDGYARNFLIPKGIAKIATEEEVKNLESKIEKLKKEEEAKVEGANKLAADIAKTKIELTEEVNEEGHLYGSVANKEIAEALTEKGFEIDPANIQIEEPIKTLGKHRVIVKVGHGVETEVEINIARKE